MGLHGPVKKFVEVFSRIPSIGPRQAVRLAFHLIHLGPAQMREMREMILSLESMAPCPRCFSVYHQSGAERCAICADELRDQQTIALVEKETDLLSFENAKTYSGRYFIIGSNRAHRGADGVREERIEYLKKQIAAEYGGSAKEIIIAISPTSYGDIAISALLKELKPLARSVSRLGRGIPMGGDVEFADEDTLREAIQRRHE